MREAGVTEISVSDSVGLARKAQSLDWFEGRPNEWLRSLYVYLKEQRAELERIKKLPLVRLENGRHVCAGDQLVFFPPDTDEDREEIKPFLNELPILMSALLEGDERNDIESFLKSLGGRVLHPEEEQMIREWLIPQYSQSDNSKPSEEEKPSVEENRLHLRYLVQGFEHRVSETERMGLKRNISETPILWAYSGVQRETYDFVAPCKAYLPQAYTGDTDLETYFSVCYDVWFVDDGYLESNSDSRDWLRFLKGIGAEDVPRFLKHYPDAYDDDQLNYRNITREKSTREETIEEYHFDGVYYVLDALDAFKEPNLSQVFWRLLAKAVSLEQGNRDALFQATYRWFYQRLREKTNYDADYYLLLKTHYAWLPDEQSKLRSPSECFAPTSENRRVLGDSVAYLHPDFDISEDNEPARWLARKLGVHLNADTESVLNYLQTLSGKTVSFKDVEPLYRFLDRQDARPREKFEEEPLIFTPYPKLHWWRSDQVFWEDESAVFGNLCGYLNAHYADTLEPFFIALGVSEQAFPLDYIRGIREVTSAAQANDAEVRKRVKILYRRLWNVLQDSGSLLEDENWQEEWKQTREGRYWLGKKGSEWDFFYLDELVWNDHDHHAHLFDGKIPFWEFDDLSDLATKLGVEACSQAEVKFRPRGEREKDEEGWSDKIRDLRPYIHAFLKSPSLCGRKYEEVKSDQVLDQLSVRLAEKLETTYKLKGIFVSDPEPRPSFLEVIAQEVTLWLGSEVDKGEYAELIGDALQDYFGIKELRGFAEDLLTKNRERILSRWKQRGLRTDFYMPSETFPEEEEEKPVELVDEEPLAETRNKDNDSVEDEFEPYTYPSQPKMESIDIPGGHWGGTSDGGGGGGGHGGGGGGESKEHRKLKEYLAANPSQLGKGLKWVKTEHIFESGDKVDILLEDRFGSPVTVEVETETSARNYKGVWQAVRYKHFAAAEYELLCQQVRSILAAPKIPDHVRTKCKQLGIEPKEVTMPSA